MKMQRCVNDSREAGDPVCATPEEIDDWLSTKYTFPIILNTKIDFQSFGDDATR